jgi:hypothetical protein
MLAEAVVLEDQETRLLLAVRVEAEQAQSSQPLMLLLARQIQEAAVAAAQALQVLVANQAVQES